jgi:hypothetical protein
MNYERGIQPSELIAFIIAIIVLILYLWING